MPNIQDKNWRIINVNKRDSLQPSGCNRSLVQEILVDIDDIKSNLGSKFFDMCFQ